MTFDGQDDFADAARRHLGDARALAAEERWDGVIHLAGFAAECALKASLERAVGSAFVGRDHGHDLTRISGWASRWVSAVVGDVRFGHALHAVEGTNLAYRHPDRRYWCRGWAREDAEAALEQAATLVRDEVFADVLDRSDRPWGMD